MFHAVMPKAHEPSWSRKPDGRPYANIIVKGKRRRVSLLAKTDKAMPSDEQCERRLARLVRNVVPALAAAQEKPRTIWDICDWYVETIMPARGYKPVTQQQNRVIFRRWCDALAKHDCSTSEDLAKNQTALDAIIAARLKKSKPGTVRKEIVKLKAVFDAAVSRKLIPARPVTDWPRIKLSAPDYHEIAAQSDVSAFLARMDGSIYAPITRFIALVGCRPVDACSLTIDRVKGLTGDAPAVAFRQHKTGQPVIVPLSREAAAVIRREAGERRKGLVFLTRGKEPIDPNHLGVALRQFGADFTPPITAKTLRQSVVNTLLDLGYDLETVRRMTGHRSDAIYAYRKLRGEHVRNAAEAIANGLQLSAIGVPERTGTPTKTSTKYESVSSLSGTPHSAEVPTDK